MKQMYVNLCFILTNCSGYSIVMSWVTSEVIVLFVGVMFVMFEQNYKNGNFPVLHSDHYQAKVSSQPHK